MQTKPKDPDEFLYTEKCPLLFLRFIYVLLPPPIRSQKCPKNFSLMALLEKYILLLLSPLFKALNYCFYCLILF